MLSKYVPLNFCITFGKNKVMGKSILESAPQGRRRLQSFFPKSDVLLVMETLPFLSPHRRRQDTRGPNELFFPKRCSRDRAEAQETAGNTADGVQRKPEVTTKSHSGARFHLLMPPESTIKTGLGTCWGESQNEVQESVGNARV